MKRGRVTCWNFSWMKSRMESARARPDGPVVRVGQSMVMDITCFAVSGGNLEALY